MIRNVVELQELIGLDVIVHGEPERNDMVQYFAENLDGFAVTRDGPTFDGEPIEVRFIDNADPH